MNGVGTRPKTLREARGGNDKWVLGNLPQDTSVAFTREVIPLTQKKAGCLQPWEHLTVAHVQEIINTVFGEGKYKVVEEDVWYGLVHFSCAYNNFFMNIPVEVNMCLHNWHNGFAQAALNTINLFVERNASALTTKELIAEEIKGHLEKVNISQAKDKVSKRPNPNTTEVKQVDEETYTYVFQWEEWSTEAKERKVSAIHLVMIS